MLCVGRLARACGGLLQPGPRNRVDLERTHEALDAEVAHPRPAGGLFGGHGGSVTDTHTGESGQ